MTVSAVVGWVQSQVDSMLAYAHPRCMDWPMVSFYHLLAGVAAYLCLLGIAKKMMVARRKGYDMTRFSIVHNLAMTCLSAYMFVETARQAYINNYTLWNNAVDPSPAGYGMARIIYIFYLSKYLEFIDSFIIVARFKLRQLAFIHVYHHASIVFICWAACYFWPGGDTYFAVMLNSFVHIILYGYYFATCFIKKPEPNKKVHWSNPFFWRKYITTLQLAQFMAMLVQSVYMLTVKDARYSRKGAAYLCLYMITMQYVFGAFFRKNYRTNPAPGKTSGPKTHEA
ncbi:Elongation of fatty acids protein [Plasmodiophora brassicae]